MDSYILQDLLCGSRTNKRGRKVSNRFDISITGRIVLHTMNILANILLEGMFVCILPYIPRTHDWSTTLLNGACTAHCRVRKILLIGSSRNTVDDGSSFRDSPPIHYTRSSG